MDPFRGANPGELTNIRASQKGAFIFDFYPVIMFCPQGPVFVK